MDEKTLTRLLRAAADAHHKYETSVFTPGVADPNWPEWYAGYIMKHWVDGDSCVSSAIDALIGPEAHARADAHAADMLSSLKDDDTQKRFFADFY